jgi:hypothetical protein
MFDWVFWNDPNFLQWIGWVRDNLKNMRQKYILSVYQSQTQKKDG